MLTKKRLFSTLLFYAALSFSALAQEAEPDLIVHDLGVLTDEDVTQVLWEMGGAMKQHQTNAKLNSKSRKRLDEYDGMPTKTASYIKHYSASYGGSGKIINIESDVIYYIGIIASRSLQISSNVKVDLFTYMDSNLQVCQQYVAQVSPLVVNSRIAEVSYLKETLCGTPLMKEDGAFSMVGLKQINAEKVRVTPSEWMLFERPVVTLR
jgi:hypothetical protein